MYRNGQLPFDKLRDGTVSSNTVFSDTIAGESFLLSRSLRRRRLQHRFSIVDGMRVWERSRNRSLVESASSSAAAWGFRARTSRPAWMPLAGMLGVARLLYGQDCTTAV